ncbi:ABC transporter ATP-binding protein [Oceanomicrobium pacificus]|uniref:ATP-binding cassette domain-containing protein n=1 Tax=Oceanomicrobium pacificus TaxID=2692916 RepID=A0A6B0TNZ2_9RHOB|nr:ABC transporter ATP-binding protein [Oceanomicrobium pacificus]MXU64309.1 ATP-binding cassette domain-containing protein [Oceanomicrobium pacificus]
MTGTVVETRGLTRRFGDKTAVDHVDLRIAPGEIYGFLGPNGSGKTTLMRMMTGLLTPSEGSATVLGTDLPGNAEPLKQAIGYMTQNFSHYRDLTVRENLGFVGNIYGVPRRDLSARIDELLVTYDLVGQADQRVGGMSGGQRQKMALAAAVLHRPKLLFLDEPTSAVDPETRRNFWEQLFDLVDEGASIIVSTHFMDEAERCHRIAILERGVKRIDGAPPALMRDLPAQVVEVTGRDMRGAKARLDPAPEVLSTAQIGARLRVLLRPDLDRPEAVVRTILGAREDVSAEQVDPNLEDVFVAATTPELAA